MTKNYLTFTLASFLLFIMCTNKLDEERQDVFDFAHLYSHTSSTRDWNDPYWDAIGDYMSSDDYNDVVEFSRDSTWKRYIQPEEIWNWDSDSLQQIYKGKRLSLK